MLALERVRARHDLEQLLRELARPHPEDEYRVLVPGVPREGALPENVELIEAGRVGRALHGAAALVAGSFLVIAGIRRRAHSHSGERRD